MKNFALPTVIALAIAAGSVAPSQAFDLKSLFPGKGVLQEHKVDGTHGKRKRHGKTAPAHPVPRPPGRLHDLDLTHNPIRRPLVGMRL